MCVFEGFLKLEDTTYIQMQLFVYTYMCVCVCIYICECVCMCMCNFALAQIYAMMNNKLPLAFFKRQYFSYLKSHSKWPQKTGKDCLSYEYAYIHEHMYMHMYMYVYM